jgi:esterase/lipase superfamily enzyme
LLGLVTACATSVDYGKVPHSAYVADPRCNSTDPKGGSTSSGALFVATTRLPDCRGANVELTAFRSEQLRYGRFDEPRTIKPEKGKSFKVVPLAFQAEAAWWADLQTAAAKNNGRVLVYVHGYRETFESTSKDSFQIARLTGFDGPVIQYTWPSQGELLRYVVDETNMYWDERNFRKFLQKLARQPWLKDIVLVSHSLGARLVVPAVEFVDMTSASEDSSNISNIILASPDIDREDFERDIAEEVLSARRVNNNRRITVYASRSDKALALSRGIHGYPRLGSPYCFNPFEAAQLKAKGLPERCYAAKSKYDVAPEKSGFTIIDTTDVSRTSSGHSDYLSSGPACLDFRAVVRGEDGQSAGRQPTSVAHVFTLSRPGKVDKMDKAEDQSVCKKPTDK